MTDRYKFRGKVINAPESMGMNGNWIYGYYFKDLAGGKIRDFIKASETDFEVDTDTVGMWTGLVDKNGKDIYEGDYISKNTLRRSTQTHVGDNIPRGSYTEPLEPEIICEEGLVKFAKGSFFVDWVDGHVKSDDFFIPLGFECPFWDEQACKDAVSWEKNGKEYFIWDDPEEGDLQYILETYKFENIDALCDHLNGLEITGNVHDK